MRAGIIVNVTRADRHQLQAIIRDRGAPQKHVWRAKIILATADGCGTAEIMRRSGKAKPVVWRWQERFMKEGVDGLLRDKTRKPGKRPLSATTVQKVVDLVTSPPPGETTHWSGRMLAKAAGISLRSVQRILEAHQLEPHRVRAFKLSNDPKFAEKLRDIVGLYVNPPAHAVVLSVDEKSQIQALDRSQPGLPMKPGRAGTMTHDYKRHRCTGPEANGNPRDRRQLRHPQTPEGPKMADATPALDFPLHANFRFLAQRHRGLLRQTHQQAPQTRRVPIRHRARTRHRALHRRN
jgi:transposase